MFATVGAQEDVDGACQQIRYCVNRERENKTVITMSASEARALSRRLKKWADLIDPPKRRRA